MLDPNLIDSSRLETRTEIVAISGLEAAKNDGKLVDAKLKIQQLSGDDLSRVVDSITINNKLEELSKAAATASGSKKQTDIRNLIASLLEILGLDEKACNKTVERQSVLLHGIIEPEMTRQQIVILDQKFGVDMLDISNRIMTLSGMGANLKPRGSGKRKKSGPPAN